MIIDINVKNLPRQSGKSNFLKLEILRKVLEREEVIVILPNINMLKDYKDYFCYKFNLYEDDLIFLLPSQISNRSIFRNEYSSETINIFIDEVFMVDANTQSDMLEIFEKSEYKISITAVGTQLPERTFSDYISN